MKIGKCLTHVFTLFAIWLLPSASQAFWIVPVLPGHRLITTNALTEIVSVIDLTPDGETPFAPDAELAIVKANLGTDDPDNYAPHHHFDNETFEEGGRSIIRARNRIVAELLAGDRKGAWKQLGRVLHSIQDFYAHSTWVELRADTGSNQVRLARHFETGPASDSDERRFGFFMTDVFRSGPEPGCTDDKYGRSLIETQNLTSGYYKTPIDYDDDLPRVGSSGVRKCAHLGATVPIIGHGLCPSGLVLWLFFQVPIEVCLDIGLEKDAPATSGHGEARRLATEASKKFVQDIVLELEALGSDEGNAAVCHLLGRPASSCGVASAADDGIFELRRLCINAMNGYYREQSGPSTGSMITREESYADQSACVLDSGVAADPDRLQTFCRRAGQWIPKTSTLNQGANITRTLSVQADGTFSGLYVTSSVTSGTGPNATVISRHFEVGAEANSTTHLAEGWFIRNENSSLGQNGKADKVWMAMGPSKASDSDAYVIALLKSGNLAPDQPVPAYCSN